jgi:hypothetical protein
MFSHDGKQCMKLGTRSMSPGSSHARTGRSATGQTAHPRGGRQSVAAFFPGRRASRHHLRLLRVLLRDRLACRRRDLPLQGGRLCCPPAERQRTQDQGPMAPDGAVSTHLILCPAQGLLDLFLALRDPHPRSIEVHYVRRGGRDMGVRGGHTRRGPVRHQIPRRRDRQRRGVLTGDHEALGLRLALGPARRFQDPPALRMAVATPPQERLPPAKLRRLPRAACAPSEALPSSPSGCHQAWDGFSASTYGTPNAARSSRNPRWLSYNASATTAWQGTATVCARLTISVAIAGLVRNATSLFPLAHQRAGVYGSTSRGEYTRGSAHRLLTETTPWSMFPIEPRHCRPTWAVFVPHVRSPVSSMTKTPCVWGARPVVWRSNPGRC